MHPNLLKDLKKHIKENDFKSIKTKMQEVEDKRKEEEKEKENKKEK